ncbi:MAG: hypothetical protein WAW41_00485 [Methylobacter sp.]
MHDRLKLVIGYVLKTAVLGNEDLLIVRNSQGWSAFVSNQSHKSSNLPAVPFAQTG